MALACAACGGRLHHSRLKNWLERARWRATGQVPWRCQGCGGRSWNRDQTATDGTGPREVHPKLTDRELDRLDPDDAQGEAT